MLRRVGEVSGKRSALSSLVGSLARSVLAQQPSLQQQQQQSNSALGFALGLASDGPMGALQPGSTNLGSISKPEIFAQEHLVSAVLGAQTWPEAAVKKCSTNGEVVGPSTFSGAGTSADQALTRLDSVITRVEALEQRLMGRLEDLEGVIMAFSELHRKTEVRMDSFLNKVGLLKPDTSS